MLSFCRRAGLFAVTIAMAPGCATMTTTSRQSLAVTTEPPGAVCKVTRDAVPLGLVNPTPGSLDIEKGHGRLHIACGKEGYLPASAEAAAQFQGMTFGNVLLGGLVGVAIDAASGAMYFYSDSVRVVLVPARFDSLEARDSFFADLSARVTKRATEATDQLNKTCVDDRCRRELREIIQARDQQLAEFERQKTKARIGSEEPRPAVSSQTDAKHPGQDPLAAAEHHLSAQGCRGPLQPLGQEGEQQLYHVRCQGYELSLRCGAQTCEELFKLQTQ
jgi:hypothetical protein